MANLMLYAKARGDARFGAVDMAGRTFPVGLMYATIVPEAKLEVLRIRKPGRAYTWQALVHARIME